MLYNNNNKNKKKEKGKKITMINAVYKKWPRKFYYIPIVLHNDPAKVIYYTTRIIF